MSDSKIGIKLGDGSFYPILDEDATKRKRLVLTTVKENQTSVKIDLYRGKGPSIAEAVYVGSIIIEHIEPSQKGDPEIELMLGKDKEDNLVATAADLKSGERQTLSVALQEDTDQQLFDIPDFSLEDDDDFFEDEDTEEQKEDVELEEPEEPEDFLDFEEPEAAEDDIPEFEDMEPEEPEDFLDFEEPEAAEDDIPEFEDMEPEAMEPEAMEPEAMEPEISPAIQEEEEIEFDQDDSLPDLDAELDAEEEIDFDTEAFKSDLEDLEDMEAEEDDQLEGPPDFSEESDFADDSYTQKIDTDDMDGLDSDTEQFAEDDEDEPASAEEYEDEEYEDEEYEKEPADKRPFLIVLLAILLVLLLGGAGYLIYTRYADTIPVVEEAEPEALDPVKEVVEEEDVPEVVDGRIEAPEAPKLVEQPDPPVPVVKREPEPDRPAVNDRLPRDGVWYRIKRGDTLWDISKTFYNSPWLYGEIAEENNIRNPDLIYAETRIFIPPKK